MRIKYLGTTTKGWLSIWSNGRLPLQ